jgi:hypothetical protein
MKERFTAEEWERLKPLPLQLFVLVAGVDGNVDDAELATFSEQVGKAALLKNALHRELLIALLDDGPSNYWDQALDAKKTMSASSAIKPILKSKLTASEYQDFLKSLFIGVLQIANASGNDGPDAGNVSEDEAKALQVIAYMYDLDLSFLRS